MNGKEAYLLDILHDEARLSAIAQSGVMEIEADPVYNFLVEKICFDLRVPIGFISIVDKDRQFFQVQNGFPLHLADLREMPLDLSLCHHIVRTREPLIINDISEDYEFHQHPIRAATGLVAYLGRPLFFKGEVIGAVCAVHTKPRYWTREDQRKLAHLTLEIQAEIYYRKLTE